MIRSISPLRYPGGKKNLTNFLASVLKINKINNGIYVEPFAGGAGAALNLMVLEHVHNIVINDADYNVYCFWMAVLNDTGAFAKRIQSVRVTVNTWKKQKKILDNTQNYDQFDVGFATFFLNRCNRSGILNAGPIGGFDQSGPFKIDARFNKKELSERVEEIAYYRDRIKVYNLDAIDLLKMFSNSKRCLIYIDPPYFVGGKKLYLNYYKSDDHCNLSQFIQSELFPPWVLSYDNVPEISALYSERKSLTYDLRYSANIAKTGKEIMFFSDNLSIPQIETKFRGRC